MKEDLSNKLNGYFEVDETYESDVWIRTKIRTYAFGKNRNNSDIAQSSMSEFSKAKKSIGAIPIVARYNTDKDDLEGHNVILRKNKDDEYEMFHDTDALGFTSPTANFYLEEVNEGTEDSPDYKTYVVIDDVYLWKRFDATKKILEWKDEGVPAKISMEIEDVSGNFDEDGYFAISDFVFSAITALGSDVEPCFKMAEIQTYSTSEFKSDLKQMMYELTNKDDSTLEEIESSKEGGKEVTEIKPEVIKPVVEPEVETQEFQISEEEFNKLTQDLKEAQDKVAEFTGKEQFHNDTLETLKSEHFTAVEALKEAHLTEVGKLTEELKGFSENREKFESAQAELAELRVFKRETELNSVRAKFAGKLSEDALEAILTEGANKSTEELESTIFAEIGKRNFSIEVETPKVQTEIQFSQKPETPKGEYGALIAKHSK